MKLTGAGFPEIVRDLGRKVGVDVPESAGGYSSEARTQLGQIERLNAAAGAYYQRMLLDNTAGAPARAYLDGRGIQHNTMAQFQIGYALPEWDGLTKAMLKEGFAPADLVAAGLSIPRDQSGQQKAAVSGHYDRFRARVMFPIMDQMCIRDRCFLDITASHENRKTIIDVVEQTAARVFMPLTVGGRCV